MNPSYPVYMASIARFNLFLMCLMIDSSLRSQNVALKSLICVIMNI